MYSLLMFIGFCSIIWGVYTDKKPRAKEETAHLEDILLRIENLEDMIMMSQEVVIEDIEMEEEEEEEAQVEFEDVLKLVSSQLPEEESEDSGLDSEVSRVIALLVDGRCSLEDACRILNMNKGEVLLLKNLYRKS